MAQTTATETDQPLPLPSRAQEMLRAFLDAGGTGFIDGEDRIVAGTPDRPGRVAPGDAGAWMTLVGKALVGGERRLLILKRRGRHLARHGTLATFDDTLTDVDLAAWAKGEIDYLTGELLEAVDGRLARVVTSRREALDLLVAEGVIRPDQAREDV